GLVLVGTLVELFRLLVMIVVAEVVGLLAETGREVVHLRRALEKGFLLVAGRGALAGHPACAPSLVVGRSGELPRRALGSGQARDARESHGNGEHAGGGAHRASQRLVPNGWISTLTPKTWTRSR